MTSYGVVRNVYGCPAQPTVRVLPLLASGFVEWPTVLNLVELWDESMGWRISDLNATSLRLSFTPAYESLPTPAPFTALDDLARWTDLPNDRLGFMLGASRRSIYNWRHRAAVPKDTSGRLVRAHELLALLAARRTPAAIRSWLTAGGSSSPLQLLHEERWDEVEALITSQVRARTSRPRPQVEESADHEAFGAETRRQMFSLFRTASQLPARRPNWRPREITGLGDEETDGE